jgi:hypothetical protein
MRRDDREQIENLKTQFEYLKTVRATRETDWKEVQQFVAPSVFSWGDPSDKNPRRPRRFTSRPTHFLKTLRSGIVGYSISPNIVWLKLSFENLAHLNLYGVKDWLEEVERVLYAEFNRSNLYPQVGKFIEYAATYGHAAMLIDEQIAENRLRFSTHTTAELYLDINEFDEVTTLFRYFTMSLRNAAAFFGAESLSEPRKADLTDKRKWNQELTIIHAVYPRETFDPDSPAAGDMPYASIYLDEAQEHILAESGYTEFPYTVFTWDPITGSAYGDSPAVNALDDIKLLNKHEEARIKIMQMSAEPAYNVPESMRGAPISVVPNGYNYYGKPDEIIKPIQTGANYPVALQVTGDIENRIKDWFHVDFFLTLQHERPANVTATYVMELQGEKASTLSSLVVNINAALTRIIQRSFNILWRQRKIPPPPEALERSGAQLKVDFTGPLAQAQKKYHESSGIVQGINLIGAFAKLKETALDVVNFDQALKTGLEGAGFPQNAINEDADIEQMRMARAMQEAQARQQAQAIEEQKAVLGNYQKLNEPVQPGSVLEELRNGGVV